jgi:hypothetical protein
MSFKKSQKLKCLHRFMSSHRTRSLQNSSSLSSSSGDDLLPNRFPQSSIELESLPASGVSAITGVNLGRLETFLGRNGQMQIRDGVSFLIAHALFLRMRRVISDALSLSRIGTHCVTHDSVTVSDLPALPFALLSAEQRYLAGDRPRDDISDPDLTAEFVVEGPDGRPRVDLTHTARNLEKIRELLREPKRRLEVSLHDVMDALKDDRTVDLNKLRSSQATAFLRANK